MNRSVKDSLVGRNIQQKHHHHHRGLSISLNGAPSDDYNLDLFSRSRRSFSVASTDEPDDLSVKLGRLSLGIGSVQKAKNGSNDLLSTPDGGKHDYDWLLTPPGTPMFPSSEGNESQADPGAPRNSLAVKSVTTIMASRLSVSQSSESNNRHRPARSSSVTRSSVPTSQFSSHSNKSSSILNTSSASVSSYIRSSTPSRRPSSTGGRPSTPSARPTLSRSSTPAKVHPTPNISADQTRPSQNSRPSTPSSRPQTTGNVNSSASRPSSRPSTPTRRNSAPILSTSGPSVSVGRSVPNICSTTSTSRPSSPSPRVLSTPPPVILTDFSLETPRNLRTTLPDRPLSAGRSRPGAAVTVKGNVEGPGTAALPGRPSSPIVTRGRLQEPSPRGKIPSNGLVRHTTDPHRHQHVSDSSSRKPVKTSTESPGLGRSISKKSMDMAIRHMDIRNSGSNSVRPNSGSTLFPQSIRSANNKIQISPSSAAQAASMHQGLPTYHNGAAVAENDNYAIRSFQIGKDDEEEISQFQSKLAAIDIYESSRYDTILLKEDLKNGSWLHSFDDKSDHEAIFDNGFDSLPEPFDPL